MNLLKQSVLCIAAVALTIFSCKKDKTSTPSVTTKCDAKNSLITERSFYKDGKSAGPSIFIYDSISRLISAGEILHSYTNDSIIVSVINVNDSIATYLDDMKRPYIICYIQNGDTLAKYRLLYNSNDKLQSCSLTFYGFLLQDSISYNWREGNIYSAVMWTPSNTETYLFDYYPELSGLQHFGYETFMDRGNYGLLEIPLPFSFFPQLSCKNLVRNCSKVFFQGKYDTLVVKGIKDPLFDENNRLIQYEKYSVQYTFIGQQGIYQPIGDTDSQIEKNNYRCK